MECFRSFLRIKKCCCELSRKEQALQRARNKLSSEINIVEIVKAWRYYDRAFHYLLPEQTRFDFKERSRYRSVDPDFDFH
jgi:hypothetical protein